MSIDRINTITSEITILTHIFSIIMSFPFVLFIFVVAMLKRYAVSSSFASIILHSVKKKIAIKNRCFKLREWEVNKTTRKQYMENASKMKRKAGRPMTNRARKFERLAMLLECSSSQAYCFINGSRKALYPRGKLLDRILGGGVDVWCNLGMAGIKADLFNGWGE
jgi:hypothetical protein